jgi:ketosteroid isomerase-like protein
LTAPPGIGHGAPQDWVRGGVAMRVLIWVLAALALTVEGAAAQNLSLRAPAWAQPLLASDIIPTLGGRATLAEEGVITAVRVTIAPLGGGVARVIRFDAREDGSTIALRRFTGHPTTGWWLWGPDTPHIAAPTAAQAREIADMARGLSGVAGVVGGAQAGFCASGEQAFVELFANGRSTSLSRTCVATTDAAGRLVTRLSEIAGSRNDEELAAAAREELLAVDRAFAAMAARDGVPKAFEHYASARGIIVTSEAVLEGREAIVARYAQWPEGARLEWAPEAARVSSRGDMGWTWGNSVHTAPDGARTRGRYVSVWTRDFEGNWRYAFEAAIR